MGSAQVPLKLVWRLLEQCAPGSRWELREHRYWVSWGGKTFRGLPKGAHTGVKQVAVGHVRQMVRFFDIDRGCAGGVHELLR